MFAWRKISPYSPSAPMGDRVFFFTVSFTHLNSIDSRVEYVAWSQVSAWPSCGKALLCVEVLGAKAIEKVFESNERLHICEATSKANHLVTITTRQLKGKEENGEVRYTSLPPSFPLRLSLCQFCPLFVCFFSLSLFLPPSLSHSLNSLSLPLPPSLPLSLSLSLTLSLTLPLCPPQQLILTHMCAHTCTLSATAMRASSQLVSCSCPAESFTMGTVSRWRFKPS